MSLFDDPAHFGRLWADVYDDVETLDPDPAVAFLAPLADGGRALELAIGTGRVGLALAARGVAVEGVEGSPEMVARLREKPGGTQIPVVVADMADVPVEGPYQLVYLVYNTLFNLLDPRRQEQLFRGVARVLGPGGAFVVEAYVPDPSRFNQGSGSDLGRVKVLEVTEETATIEIYSLDAPRQRFVSQTVTFGSGGVSMYPHAERYCWPAELDLMARQAGLRLVERHEDWRGKPFDSGSRNHISVYRPA